MSSPVPNDFGVVPEHGDHFEFHIDRSAGGICRLINVLETERGPRREPLAEIPYALWRKISVRVVRELSGDMGKEERTRAAPKLRLGFNRLSPLVGRELAMLLLVLQEEGAREQLEAILHSWRELAREERWWLYSKATAPGQRAGMGWRRALYHALAETTESRVIEPAAEKKSPKKSRSSSVSGKKKTLPGKQNSTRKTTATRTRAAKPGKRQTRANRTAPPPVN